MINCHTVRNKNVMIVFLAGISPQEVMKKLADRWKSLPDQEKEVTFAE